MTYIPGAVAAKIRARGMNVDVELARIRKRKEDERRLALFDEMLAALKAAHQAITIEHILNPEYGWAEFLADEINPIIAKAEGK